MVIIGEFYGFISRFWAVLSNRRCALSHGADSHNSQVRAGHTSSSKAPPVGVPEIMRPRSTVPKVPAESFANPARQMGKRNQTP